jgi:hypothetical protein
MGADDDFEGWFAHRNCATCRKAWRRDLALYVVVAALWVAAGVGAVWAIVWMPPA